MARALVASGHHGLNAYCGPAAGAPLLNENGLTPRRIPDLEEVLADPAIGAVIVGGRQGERPAQLRRALQSERHVLCACPVDETPDIAYEAAMIQRDTHCVLLPLLPEALHPAFGRLAQFISRDGGSIGSFQLLKVERWCSDVPDDRECDQPRTAKSAFAGVPLVGWDVLRILGGEIVEVSGFATGDEWAADEPLLVTGRFERGGLFQATLLPFNPEPAAANRQRWTVVGKSGRATLVFPKGWPGPASLCWENETADRHQESWETWDPWQALVEVFDATLKRAEPSLAQDSSPSRIAPGQRDETLLPLSWQTTIRALELDDAVRRSVKRRRASTLEYPEATEEVGFKGTMTLLGCGLLWIVLLLVILSPWMPWLGWVVVPILLLFLGLQLLRWIVPRSAK
jgi:predicted dehydrogenase